VIEMMVCCRAFFVGTLLCCAAVPLAAQDRSTASPLGADALSAAVSPESADLSPPSALRPLRVAKWSTLAASIAAASYGFVQQRSADSRYTELERRCQEDLQRCGERLPSGAFADASMESMYQEVVRRDRNARLSLVSSQFAVVGTVVFFLLDLRGDDAPPNQPYEPLRMGMRADGGIELGLRFPAGSR
jgi:hypothetical protein